MARATIVTEFRFESAHRLPRVPAAHKCARLHGHSYRCEVFVSGPVDAHTGWIADYQTVLDACEPLRDALDHRYLNEIDGLDNPTSEVIGQWIWARLKPVLPGLTKLVVHETCCARFEYEGA